MLILVMCVKVEVKDDDEGGEKMMVSDGKGLSEWYYLLLLMLFVKEFGCASGDIVDFDL